MTTPVTFTSGATVLTLRGPSALSGSVRLLQAEEFASGWQRFGFAPLAIVHTLTLQHNRLNGAERAGLDAFFDTVDFSAKAFTYTDAAGNPFPVQFQTPVISLDEASYDLYRASITLWSAQTFFAAAVVPTLISALLNGGHYPEPVKRIRKQPLTRLSDGTACIYNKSSITRTTRTVALVRISRDDLASLLAHFISVGGIRDWWTWTLPLPTLILAGTTNLIPSTAARCSATTGFSADAGSTLSIDATTAAEGSNSLKCITDGSGATGYYYSGAGVTISPSTIYSALLQIKGAGTINLMLRAYPSNVSKSLNVTLTGTWQLIKLEGLLSGAADNIARIIMRYTTPYAGTFWTDALQLEQKTLCTPWVDGTRADIYSGPATRTCRYATPEITWQRSTVRSSTYDAQVSLEEDVVS